MVSPLFKPDTDHETNPSGNVTETSNFIYSATVPAVGSERGDCNESDDGSSVGTLEDATVFTCSELTDELRKKLGFPESITPPLGLVVE